jgi:serine/threonine-protein kinase
MDVSEEPRSAQKRVGRYELLKQIDRGVLGALWAARFDHQGTSLAALVRTVEPPPNMDTEVWEALTESAWTAIDLQAPGIVHCADVVFQGPTLALVDDYVEGQPLSSLLRIKGGGELAFPVGVVLRIAKDTISALNELLAASQDLGVDCVHGGVSPDVLLVGTDGMTRILNPLVSAAAAREEYFKTLPERAPYLAPEQWLQKSVDQRSDVYAVGCILWELMTRKRLHAGSAANIRRCATSDRLPMPLTDARAHNVPQVIMDILRKALAPEAAQRFQTLKALGEALQACAIPLAPATEVARFVETLASARLVEQRAATENSTIAHLTDFFKAERPVSTRPPAPGLSAKPAAAGEQPKLKLGLVLKKDEKPKTSSPDASVRPAPAKPSVVPNVRPVAVPNVSALPGAPLQKAKSVVPPLTAPATVAPVARGVMKHGIVSLAPANDASVEGRADVASKVAKPAANTTLIGISPAQIMQQAAAARVPEPLPVVSTTLHSPSAITVPAGPSAEQAAVDEDEEELTSQYDDLMIVASEPAARPQVANDVPIAVPPLQAPPVPEPRAATAAPVVAPPAHSLHVSAPAAAAPAVQAAPVASRAPVAPAVVPEWTPAPHQAERVASLPAESVSEPTVSLADLHSPEAVMAEPNSMAASREVAPAKRGWPPVTWFFMGCTVSLGLVVLSNLMRTETPKSESAVVPTAITVIQTVPLPPSASVQVAPPSSVNLERVETVAPSTSASAATTSATGAPSASSPSVSASASVTAAPTASLAPSTVPVTSASAALPLAPAPRVSYRSRSSNKAAASKPSSSKKGGARGKYIPKDL